MQDNPNGSAVVSDSVTLASIRNFIADESKPQDFQPIDTLLTVVAMLRKAEEQPFTESQQTLAKRLCCSVDTVQRSLKRLGKADYFSQTRRRGRTTEFVLNSENIPAEAPLRLRITEDAGTLAVWYKLQLSRRGRKKFHKFFIFQQKITAQRILNSRRGDIDRAKSIIAFALDGRHSKKAYKSLYNLFGRWEAILSEFEEYAISKPTPEMTFEAAQTIAAAPKAVEIPAEALPDGCRPYGPISDGRWQDASGHLLSVTEGQETLRSCGLEQFGTAFYSIDNGQALPEALALGVMASGTRFNGHRRAA